MKILLIIIMLILFLPIPIKISICYTKENYYLKIYNINLLKNKQKNKKKKKTSKRNTKLKKENKKKSTFFKTFKPTLIIKTLDKNKFKPYLWLKGEFSYSFNDAAKTAISYGSLSSISLIILRLIQILFKTKKVSIPIKPLFKDEFLVNIRITSIICFSIVQIIYIFFLILKEVIQQKEAKPNKGII